VAWALLMTLSAFAASYLADGLAHQIAAQLDAVSAVIQQAARR
jgi:hypothetical protein